VSLQTHELQARRAARARELRRRRRRAGAVIVVLTAAVVALFVVLTSSGGSARRAASSSSHRAAVRHHRSRSRGDGRSSASTGEPTPAQLAAVRRLAAYGLPMYCAGRSKRVVALTFDDGPGPYTPLAIKKLSAAHLRATFFLVGKSIHAYPTLARREKPVAAVGDHTMTHPFLPGLSQAEMSHEIADARTLIQQSSGQQVGLFRPPYGSRTAAIDAEAKALGLLEVLWTVDSRDSLGADYAGIEQNAIAGLHPGSIILMHENRGQTIRALPVIFAALARDHLHAVTVPELVAEDPPSLAQLRAGPGGCGTKLTARSGG
jgi:peptidoglycan/xylan/chitin deacetylase (PgdA/CDA1 family)